MFKGFVLSESLNDPTALNKFKQEYVKIEHHPESGQKFWHLFKPIVPDSEIEAATTLFAKEIKYGWYAHFWNEKLVYVVLCNKVFKIPREQKRNWTSKEYQEMKEYAEKHGVDKRYLDFLVED